MKFFLSVVLLFIFSNIQIGNAQTLLAERNISIKKITDKIEIDGKLGDKIWLELPLAKDFIQNFPYDTSYSTTKTEVKICYDEKNIYVAAWMFDTLPNLPYIIQSFKRDWSYPLSDAFAVSIDPFNDKTNGFSFAVNPLGAQREGLIAFGGGFGVSTDWDNKWTSEVGKFEHGWTAEFAIPFKTLRFKGGEKTWRINFHRNNLKINESSCWSYVPRVFNISSLVFTGKLNWDEPLKNPGLNFSIIPYAIGSTSKNYSEKKSVENKLNSGFDAKLSITPSLNLDVTINPDFAQVEVDRQVINLTRFSIFFPERRQFFIENSDLFANFGFRQIRPFFSRKIGLEQSVQGNVNMPIIAGARISGKINNKLRVGLMNVQTNNYKDFNLNATNFSVLSFQRQVFKASNIAAIFVNREGFDANNNLTFKNYNRVAGLEFNEQSADKKWMGKMFYMRSFSPTQQDNSYTHASWLTFTSINWSMDWNHEFVGKGFDAQTGFVPHLEVSKQLFDTTSKSYNFSTIKMSYWRLEPHISYKYYPASKIINKLQFGLYGSMYFDSSFQANDVQVDPFIDIAFQNSASLSFSYSNNYTKLYFPLDISGTGLTPLPAADYNYALYSAEFESNKRKPFYFNLGCIAGNFFNGERFSYRAAISYRHQPWGTYSLSITREHLTVSNGQTNLLLIGPQAELSFSRKVFFSTFVQYNTQAENININSRLQWRFKPMSDLFIVYTDNYQTPPTNSYKDLSMFDYLKVKNRALVIKFIYWFNG